MDYDDFGGAASGAAYGFMEIKFKPKGVCSQSIRLDLTDGIVHNVRFAGGCSGNAQGIIYNKKVAEAAGYTSENLPKTPDEFLTFLQAIKDKSEG